MANYESNQSSVKKPKDDKPLTVEEAREWLKCANDPYYFFTTYCKVATPTGIKMYQPRDYQEDMLKDIIDNDFMLFNAPRQTGKRLCLNTVVPTPTGYTTIGNLKVGDWIIGSDGNPVRVVYLSPIEMKADSYEVEMSTGEVILADAEHLWEVNQYTASGENKKSVMTTKDMIDRGIYIENSANIISRFSIDTIKPAVFPERELENDPYLLGNWLSVVSQAFLELNYSDGTRIPLEYLRSSIEQRTALLQGIMDVVGDIDSEGNIEVTVKRKELIEDIHELVSSLGIKMSVPKQQPDESWKITGHIFSDDFECFRLNESKLAIQKQCLRSSEVEDSKVRHIVDIRKVEPIPMRCIQVDCDDHLFAVTRSYILTHNTVTLALYALHCAIFQAGFVVGITSFKNKNVVDVMSRVRLTYEKLPMFLKPVVTLYNRFTIEFASKSTIYGEVTSEGALRGRTNNLAIIDEFAFVKPSIAEEFYTSLLPSLTADGEESSTKAIFISTPNGSSGLYAQLAFGAMAGKNGFKYHKVDHNRIPGRSEAFRQKMIDKMGRNRYEQEYEGAFLSDKGTLVNSRVIESIKTKDPEWVYGDIRFFRTDLSGRKLAMACDVSEGIGKDSHAFQVFDLETLEQVAEYENNDMSQTYYAKQIIKGIDKLFELGADEVYYTVENNGVGTGVLRLLENSQSEALERATMISDADGKRTGLKTTGPTKKQSCADLKDLIEMDKMKINSELLKVQLKFFIKKGNSFAAESGMHDDLVMACVILCNMLNVLSNYEDEVHEHMNEIKIETDDDEVFDIYF